MGMKQTGTMLFISALFLIYTATTSSLETPTDTAVLLNNNVYRFCDNREKIKDTYSSLHFNGSGFLDGYRSMTEDFVCKCRISNVGTNNLTLSVKLTTNFPSDTDTTDSCGKGILMKRVDNLLLYIFGCRSESMSLSGFEPGEELDFYLYASVPYMPSVIQDQIYGVEVNFGRAQGEMYIKCDEERSAADQTVITTPSTTYSSSSSSSTSSSLSPSSTNTTHLSVSSDSVVTMTTAVVSVTEEYSMRHLVVSAVLGAVGGAIAVAIVVVIILIIIRKRRRNDPQPGGNVTMETEDPPSSHDHIYSTITSLYDSIKSRYDVISQFVSVRRGRMFQPSKRTRSKVDGSKPDLVLESERKWNRREESHIANETESSENDYYIVPISSVKRENDVTAERDASLENQISARQDENEIPHSSNLHSKGDNPLPTDNLRARADIKDIKSSPLKDSLKHQDSDSNYIHPVYGVAPPNACADSAEYVQMGDVCNNESSDYMPMTGPLKLNRESDYLEPVVTTKPNDKY